MMGDLDARVGVYYMSNSGAPAQIGEAALALLRGEDYTPPAAPKAITVDPKILDKYVGKYDLGEGVVTVIRQGDGIAVRPEGETSATELFAESPTRFFMKGQDARIVFVLDDSGAVKEMVLEAGGGKTVAPRRR
jgi:hypothetical protein